MLPIVMLLIPTLPDHPCASQSLAYLYLFRPDIVAPAIAASMKSILAESIDCPEAFKCVPLLLRDFGADLFAPFHRMMDLHFAAATDGFLCQLKHLHGIPDKLPLHSLQTGHDHISSLAVLRMLPEFAEVLLPHIDAAGESVSDTLMVFSFLFENIPSLPLSQPLQLLADLRVNSAVSDVIASINSFFTRSGAFQPSFCARFFDKIMSFCLQADQPDEHVNMGMGSKEEETGTPDVAF